MHAFTHSYIHLCLSFVYMYSFLCFVIFYLSLSFLALMHFYHVFLACSIYSFRYVYHIFISYNLILSYHIMVHLRSFTFFFLFISSHITNLYTYFYLYISNLYLFRSSIGVTKLIPIRRYLYTYLYFYLSYTCIYLILCMDNYDYHISSLFFLISGPNMSSNFIILCMVVFLTQWAFHRVQEHPNRSSDEGVMTFRSWRSYVVKPNRVE